MTRTTGSTDAPRAGTSTPTFAFFGPALGGHPGWVTTQGEVLAGLFAGDGHRVLVSSTRLNPIGRAVDHARDLVRWRNDADIAVVSMFSGRAFALAAESLALARLLGIPTVAWLHGGSLPKFGRDHPGWVRRVLRSASAVVAPSAFLGRWAQEFVPEVRVIPNVLDLGSYRCRTRRTIRPRLLWMRTFQEAYDPATAVRTLADLRSRGVAATLTMAGQDKGLLEPTRALAHELGLDDVISFPGFVAGDAKAELFDDHDIFLNTNLVDNAPVTVLEAAASGLVVVSTDVGGIPDLLSDGSSAALVDAGDAQAMAHAVRRLLDDPASAARLSGTAREVAERSGWTDVKQSWLSLPCATERANQLAPLIASR